MQKILTFIVYFFTGFFFCFCLHQMNLFPFQTETINEAIEFTEQELNLLNEISTILETNEFSQSAKEYTSASIDLMSTINLERQKKGIKQVNSDNRLICAAQIHAKDIGTRKSCSHYGKDGSSFVSRAKKCGLTMKAGGEIVACGQKSPRSAVDAWIASPGHNRIMFSPTYTMFGCDMYNNYWVCVFAK